MSNPWAVDRHRSVAHLMLGRTEGINFHYLCFICYLSVNYGWGFILKTKTFEKFICEEGKPQWQDRIKEWVFHKGNFIGKKRATFYRLYKRSNFTHSLCVKLCDTGFISTGDPHLPSLLCLIYSSRVCDDAIQLSKLLCHIWAEHPA